jgi:hypothetical protein
VFRYSLLIGNQGYIDIPPADVKCYSKTKVEKAFFFIFMSSFAEMRFLIQKIT